LTDEQQRSAGRLIMGEVSGWCNARIALMFNPAVMAELSKT
jgi:hypothetical protein